MPWQNEYFLVFFIKDDYEILKSLEKGNKILAILINGIKRLPSQAKWE